MVSHSDGPGYHCYFSNKEKLKTLSISDKLASYTISRLSMLACLLLYSSLNISQQLKLFIAQVY